MIASYFEANRPHVMETYEIPSTLHLKIQHEFIGINRSFRFLFLLI